METMHFHIAHTNLFLGQLCFAFWGHNVQFGTNEKFGAQGRLNWMPWYKFRHVFSVQVNVTLFTRSFA